MRLFSQIDTILSRVRPLWFLVAYVAAIPAFGLLYVFAVPHSFFAPYARLEPSAVSDRRELENTFEAALQRAFKDRQGEEFIVEEWKLDLDSLRVDDIKSSDGTQLSFRVRFTANGAGKFEGARTLGWSVVATIPERAPEVTFNGPNTMTFYRFPELEASTYATRFNASNRKLFEMIFAPSKTQSGVLAPVLVLNNSEDSELRNYLQGIRGDASSFSGQFWRMTYFSAVVITTLGLGDIVPITWQSRMLVALEAVAGIILAGLFLNALAYRVSNRKNNDIYNW
jgi:Ion channel